MKIKNLRTKINSLYYANVFIRALFLFILCFVLITPVHSATVKPIPCQNGGTTPSNLPTNSGCMGPSKSPPGKSYFPIFNGDLSVYPCDVCASCTSYPSSPWCHNWTNYCTFTFTSNCPANTNIQVVCSPKLANVSNSQAYDPNANGNGSGDDIYYFALNASVTGNMPNYTLNACAQVTDSSGVAQNLFITCSVYCVLP